MCGIKTPIHSLISELCVADVILVHSRIQKHSLSPSRPFRQSFERAISPPPPFIGPVLKFPRQQEIPRS